MPFELSMPNEIPLAEKHYQDALRDIGAILRATHATATAGERLVRVAWVIGKLPEALRDIVVDEAKNRVVIGWASGMKPTDW